jgi:hypothetical protein
VEVTNCTSNRKCKVDVAEICCCCMGHKASWNQASTSS